MLLARLFSIGPMRAIVTGDSVCGARVELRVIDRGTVLVGLGEFKGMSLEVAGDAWFWRWLPGL